MKEEVKKLITAIGFCSLFCIIIALGVATFLRTPIFSKWQAYVYRLLALDILCCLILLIIIVSIVAKRKMLWGLRLFDLIMSIGLSTLFMALFFALGPMPIERSYTIYSLADMSDNSDVVYSAEDIKIQFIEGYIEGANESQKRIDEQVYIGNLKEVPGGYQITEKGKNLIKIFRVVEAIFPVPDKNSIYPNGK